MPAGVSWARYLSFATVAMLTMMAGSQTVHMIYRPLDDLDDLVEQRASKLKQAHSQQMEKSSPS